MLQAFSEANPFEDVSKVQNAINEMVDRVVKILKNNQFPSLLQEDSAFTLLEVLTDAVICDNSRGYYLYELVAADLKKTYNLDNKNVVTRVSEYLASQPRFEGMELNIDFSSEGHVLILELSWEKQVP